MRQTVSICWPLLVHEIGHLLGRGHAAAARSEDVMEETLPRGPSCLFGAEDIDAGVTR